MAQVENSKSNFRFQRHIMKSYWPI